MSHTDKGCPVNISNTGAEKFWIKSSELSQFSSNSNFFSLPQIYKHHPPKHIMTHAKNQKQPILLVPGMIQVL